jgi:hypothetical protein
MNDQPAFNVTQKVARLDNPDYPEIGLSGFPSDRRFDRDLKK